MRSCKFLTLLLFSAAVGLGWTVKVDGSGATPEEIIQRFAQKENEFRELWQRYTYTQTILFQELGPDDSVAAQREVVFEVYFTSDGRRHTKKIKDQGRLKSVNVTKDDIEDAVSRQPFVLTTEDLPRYEIVYEGKKRVDELDTYVFKVTPRRIQKGERVFEGRVWVDDLDFQIVMTSGKILPEDSHNKFPKFETVREQIDGNFWFPTWTGADDVLTFGDWMTGGRSVHVREIITYSDYKKFEVDTSIEYQPVPNQ